MTIKILLDYSNKWTYCGNEVEVLPEGVVGFVYIITNTLDGRFYLGKKTGWFTKTRILKGKKKRSKVPSDWHQYYGSSEQLLQDIDKVGKENFSREILHFCISKTEMSYIEAKLQFQYDVLLKDNNYNAWISCRIRKSQLKQMKVV